MFYIVGLGLCDEKDVTIRGLKVKYVVYPDWRISYNFRRPSKDLLVYTWKHILAS